MDTKNVEIRRVTKKIRTFKVWFLERERVDELLERERVVEVINEVGSLVQGFYSSGEVRVRFGRSVRVSGT